MDHQVTKTDQQIASVLSGNANASEIEELRQWQELSAGNKNILDDSVKVWDNCPNPLTKTDREQDKAIINGRIITQIALQQKHDRVIMRFLRVAAIFIGPIMLAIGWYFGGNDQIEKEIAWNTVTAPRKHIAVCTMTDGTEVWLNAGSSISYPSGEQLNKREVKLTGEGYFKVTKNPKKPFFVITRQATVKVLGTIFNMKAYPGEDRIVTTLEEGSVEVFIRNSKIPNLRLKPGEQAIYDTKEGRIDVSKVDATLYSSWRSDKFVFKDADLKTIIAELERLYDIKIHIKNPRLETLHFRGMFSYDQDLLDAFETLHRSVNLNYTIKGRDVWLE